MGAILNSQGMKLGSVNAWSGVFDSGNRKVGEINIFSSKVYDASQRYLGQADPWGNVRSVTGRLLCKVGFWGNSVRDAEGHDIGVVGVAGAPDAMPDMQWRGAAALLLLVRNEAEEDLDSAPISSDPWYRSTALEIVLLVICNPVGVLLVLTHQGQNILLKGFAWLCVILYALMLYVTYFGPKM